MGMIDRMYRRACDVALLAYALSGCGETDAQHAGPGSSVPSPASGNTILDLTRAVAAHDPPLAKRLAPSTDLGRAWSRGANGLVSPGWLPWKGKTAAELAAHAPERADGAWELSLDRTDHYRLGVRWAGAASAGVEEVHGTLVYRNVHSATDAIVTSTRDYVEVTYLLRDRSAPTRWTWSVETGAGLGGAKRAPDGGFYIVREDGEPVWNVPAAYAVTAAGTKIGVRSEWTEGELRLELEGAPEAYPVVVDPVVTALFWVQSTPATSPAGRYDHAMAYDSTRGRTVLFSGSTVADTWEWDGVNWADRTPASSPPARFSHAMAYDAARARTVLFGPGTAEWDGTNWQQLAPQTSPAVSNSHAMAYDAARARTVLFGGYDGLGGTSGISKDTWEWDGTNWTQRFPMASPAPRTAHAMAYDSGRGRTVLFGGRSKSGDSLGDTWEWDGADWAQRSPPTSPTARVTHAMVYDSGRGRTVLFGGDDGGPGDNAIWEWDGTNWAKRTLPTSPSARLGHAMVYDSLRGRTVLFGGLRTSDASTLGDTWELALLRTVGSDCTSDAQCGSGHCADGVCCDASCGGACDVCKISLGAATEGACTVVPMGTAGSPVCPSSFQCNGTDASCPTDCARDIDCVSAHYCQVSSGKCLAKLAKGTACPDGDHSCQTGFCLSGRCSTCANDSGCNASSFCSAQAHDCVSRLANGVACPEGDDSCQSGYCASGVCTACLSDSNCAATAYCSSTASTCVPRLDVGAVCPEGDRSCLSGSCLSGACACVDDGSCSASDYCNAATHGCAPRISVGSPCPDGDHSCQSGFCIDGACRACRSSTDCSSGYCSASTHACTSRLADSAACPEGNDSCQSGFCVNGTCSECGSDFDCDPSSFCSERAHACAKTTGLDSRCPEGDHACATGRCLSSICACATDANCPSSSFCQEATGKCVSKLALGSACPDGGHSCDSSFCVDGVCCDKQCGAACQACTALFKGSGEDGACGPIAAGSDPDDECQADPDYPGSCKADGMCDGSRGCRKNAPADTPCAPTSCQGHELTTALCNGSGSCLTKTTSCSGGLGCASADACALRCASDADCAEGFACGADGTCAPIMSGATCKDEKTLLDAHGKASSCAPYRCSGGSCLRECASVDDCLEPNVCDDTRHCVAPATSKSAGDDGCGCRVERRSRPNSALTAGLTLLAISRALRRRRAGTSRRGGEGCRS